MSKNNYLLANQYWNLKIKANDNQEYIYELRDKLNKRVYADQDYHYTIVTSRKRGARYAYLDHLGTEYKAKNFVSRKVHLEDDEKLVIEGQFEDMEIVIKHEFILRKEDKWLNECIKLINESPKKIRFGSINFGFKKVLFKQDQGWVDHLDEYILTSIPTRRFFAYGDDRRKQNFSAHDILYGAWVDKKTEMPGYSAEGWLWSDSEGGLLVCKYHPSQMEYSRFSRYSMTLPGRGAENVYIIFGGVSLYDGNPELATILEPGKSYSFGVSRYATYVGDYREGYYLYRNHLEANGHKFKKDYNPPIHWNELYNLGWVAEKTGFFVNGIEFKPYTLQQLYDEAEIAKDIGAECLYLDPGWNVKLGSEIWNEERFGTLKEFSRTIHEKYGLKLALHLMMNFEGEDEPEEFYLISQKGVRVVADPYINLFCVCANQHWVKEKTRRLLKLAKDGVDFFMFDFTDFSMFMVDYIGCFNKEHCHEVPMRRQTHAENIFKVIQNVKKEHPDILIEAHDRGVKPRHPLYYQHNLPHSFDENWGFECMWNPMVDLLSNRVMQLFEYNLAYSIPLYLHINENSDNDNMLQFWWYASLVRHMGIGGLKEKGSAKYKALKHALTLYKEVKLVLARGCFFGIHTHIHLHVLGENGQAVITVYNLTSRSKRMKVELNCNRYNIQAKECEFLNGLNQIVEPVNVLFEGGESLLFEIEVPPLSPVIVILH
jgi:hypothetical protein